jgi:small subunit ribosomal protein S2
MQPYIFGKRNLIHIINVKATLKGILLARRFLARVASQGKDILFVGTKRQARKSVQEHAGRVGMHWVIDRWLGGTLTNFREIRKRVGRLIELEQLEADGLLDAYSKKEGASLRREMRKIDRNLGGIRNMERLPGAMVVIDELREIIAIREANKMGIPVVCLLDTDSDPDLVEIPIPANDDAMRAIELIVRELANSIEEGVKGRGEEAARQAGEGAKPVQRRRSRRATTARAENETSEESQEGAEGEPPEGAAASEGAPTGEASESPAPPSPQDASGEASPEKPEPAQAKPSGDAPEQQEG